MPDKNQLSSRILDVLKAASSPLMAKEIAASLRRKYRLNVTKKEVNPVLYGTLVHKVKQDAENRWSLAGRTYRQPRVAAHKSIRPRAASILTPDFEMKSTMSETQVDSDFDVAREIDRFREKLLDLSNRNPMLNYSKSKRRTLQIIDELPNLIFARLVSEGKDFRFDPLPGEKKVREEDENAVAPTLFDEEVLVLPAVNLPDLKESFENGHELPSHPASEELLDRKHQDNRLQTNLSEKRLDAVVSFIRREAQSAIQETGVNYLFLALGMLHWKDQKDSSRELFAPLILIPVEIKRSFSAQRKRYEYSLSWREEDLQYNLCLAKRLEKDFGTVLPEYHDGELPEDYFDRVRVVITEFPEWTIRREALLGFFSFQKLLMYLDIEPGAWKAKGGLSDSSLISRIVGGQEIEPGASLYASDYEIDSAEGAHDIPIIADADSSQHSALMDIAARKSLVIEGPPGTGKSQTITNAIAAAMHEGKTVLFVAEKLAALKVVSEKLRRRQLGEFCLELHSDAVSPRRVFDSLKERINGSFDRPRELEVTIKDLNRKKAQIREYLEASSVLTGPYEEPLYEVMWRVVDLRSSGIQPLREFSFDATVKRVDFDENIDLLETFAETFDELDSPRQSPWWGYWVRSLNIIHSEPIQDRLQDLQETCVETSKRISELHTTCGKGMMKWLVKNAIVEQKRITQIEALAQSASSLPATNNLALLDSKKARQAAVKLIDTVASALQLIEKTEAYLIDGRGHVEGVAPQLEELISKQLSSPFPKSTIQHLQLMRVRISTLLKALSTTGQTVAALESQGLGPIRNLREYETAELLFRLFRHPIITNLTSFPSSLFLTTSSDLYQQGQTECQAITDLQGELSKCFHWPSLPDTDELHEITQKLRPHIRSWFRLLRRDYRWAKKRLSQFWRTGIGKKPEQWLTRLEELQIWLDEANKFSERSDFSSAFGEAFQGLDTNWEDVKTLLNWRTTAENHGVDFDAASKLLSQRDRETLSARDVSRVYKDLVAELSDPDVGHALGCSKELAIASFQVLKQNGEKLNKDLEKFQDLSRSLNVTPQLTLNQLQVRLREIQEATKSRDLACAEKAWQELGTWYQGLDTETTALRAAVDWVEQLTACKLPVPVKSKLLSEQPAAICQTLLVRLRAVADVEGQWHAQRESLAAFGTVSDSWLQLFDKAGSVETAAMLLSQLKERISDLPHWFSFCRSLMHCQQKKLTDLTNLAVSGRLKPADLANCYRLTLFQRVVEGNLLSSKALEGFSRQKIERIRAQFRQLDHELVYLNQALVAHSASLRDTPAGNSRGRVGEYTEMGLVLHEIQKQKKHCRIRDLLLRAGTAVQNLKPCFMMSPLSIAQFLDPKGVEFDLVIMDEASQIKPEDAIGTILRAKQLVVVGDPKQLPPTSFFDRMGEDVADDDATQFDNAESVLEVAMKAFQPVRRLRWHYRSEHESLIHFSNVWFYDEDLVVFPSASNDSSRLGIRHHYVEDASFLGGQNVQEAKVVAEAIVQHARRHPLETLGVGTFNQKQRDLIRDSLDRLCEQDTTAREAVVALDDHPEDIFIKNLENLQGDERDVIFISYTYGPDPDSGKVHNRFGPITGEFGWRRLNVLITRARKRVEVFSSMKPTDILGGPEKSLGVNSMKDYLDFARVGVLSDRGLHTEREMDSPFELSVARVVTHLGLEIVPQVGVAGYFIDLGVVRPGNSGDYLLGIECDGATYHSSKSARDRDRLREEIIRKRDWHLHRIWSTDWFLNQKHEEERLKKAILERLSGEPAPAE